MENSDDNWVLNLAQESEKLDEIIEPHSAGIKDLQEIVGWNGEKVCISKKNSREPSVIKKRKYLSRRNSGSVPPSQKLEYNSTKIEKESSKQENIQKKQPSVVPKVIIPKFHFVQAPFQLNFSPSNIKAILDLNNSNTKILGNDSPGKYLRRSIHNSLIKKPEFINEYTLLKPMHKKFELALENLRNIKIRRINKPLSACD